MKHLFFTAAATFLPLYAAPSLAVTEEQLKSMEFELAKVVRRLDALEAENTRLRLALSSHAFEKQPAYFADKIASSSDSRLEQLSIQGDARLRYEGTRDQDGVMRNREVLRARLAANYRLNDYLTLGARLTTGDPDDPNSSDVTLGNFLDDLTVSMDRAYAEYRGNNYSVLGGKFANPFNTRELVWDGDVSPQGVATSVNIWRNHGARLVVTGLFSPIDEQVQGDDSSLLGAQINFSLHPDQDWALTASTAYYNYDIGSLMNADPGDIRDNRLNSDGSAYLSDFNMWNNTFQVSYNGLGRNRPVVLSADYVRNLGAYDDQNQGYQFDLQIGRADQPGDWGVIYSYALADIDAILTAFSHDNLTYASNYRQHRLTLEYVPTSDVVLNVTGYHYVRDRFQPGYEEGWDEWLSRLRMNVSFAF